MVVLGQWPYQHTITLSKLRVESKVGTYYFVDEDRIISLKEAKQLLDQGYILDKQYLTIMGEDLDQYLAMYRDQIFPPPIYPDLLSLIENNTPELISTSLSDVKGSAAALIINNGDSSTMEDIGAIWNSSLGVWIVDIIHLKHLRKERRDKYKGKIVMLTHPDGTLVEIRGDVSKYINLLKSIDGIYNEDRDVWHVDIAHIDKIYSIISK